MSPFKTVRGMRDLLPKEAATLNHVMTKARETAMLYGYNEVITPLVEPCELLKAKSGEEIRQRMFTFEDLGDRKVALRPEFTASIARLATTSLKNAPKPIRTFSMGSVYRYDEPQRGRYREFWQSNFEVIGSSKPEADVETILLTNNLLSSMGLKNYAFKLGHIGVIRAILTQEEVADEDQNIILQRMDKKEYAEAFKMVPQNCQRILEGLLALKCDNVFETMKNLKEHIKGYSQAEDSADNLLEILKLLNKTGCEIECLDPGFARGLEYYTGLIFEVYIPELGIALGGGGRYDKLIEVFGGEPTPATGVAHGLDRIALALQTQKADTQTRHSKCVAVIPVKEEWKSEALKIAQMLRKSGIPTEFEIMGRKMAKALEDADKRQVDYAVIVGENELRKNSVVLRDLAKREQKVVAISKLTGKIRG